MSLTSHRILQYLTILLILALFGGAYWYFKVRASTFNASQNAIDNTGLVGLWSFDGVDMTATTATDRSGQGNNGTLNGETAEVNGKIGQALHFDGSNNDNVDINDPGASSVFDFASTDPLSFSLWIYPTAYPAGYGTLWTKGPTDSGTVDGIFGLQHNTGCTTTCNLNFFYRASGSFHEYFTSSAPISLNTWHHITLTYTFGTGSSMKIYVNGKLQPGSWTAGTGDASLVDTNDSLWIGANQFDEDFIGRIDDARLYNRILSTTEVDSLYAFGSGTHVNSSVSQNQGASRLESSVALYWAFDASSGTTATDTSTNGFTGTLTNMEDPGDWVAGQIGNALDFDGSNEYVTVADDDTSLDVVDSRNFSLSGWFNRDTFAADHTVIAKRNGIANTDDGYIVYIDDTTDKLTFEASDAADTDEYQLESASTFTATGWNHFTVVWNDSDTTGGQTKLYINGTPELATATGTFGNMGSMANALAFRAGAESDAGNPFDGKLDEIRLYNRALSADEVAQLYRVTTPTGLDAGLNLYLPFNNQDMASTSAFDRSGVGHVGTLNGGVSKVVGKLGQAVSFDGSDDFITVPDHASLDYNFNEDFGLSFWAKIPVAQANTADLDNALFEKWSNNGEAAPFYVDMWNSTAGADNGKLAFKRYDLTNESLVQTNRAFNDNLWHHFVMMKSGSTMSIYADGVLEKSGTDITTTTTTNATTLCFARRCAPSSNLIFQGSIDEFRLYSRPLTTAEIQTLYAQGSGAKVNSSISQNQGTGRLDSGLAGYWTMDDNTGTTATDSSTNGANGTFNGNTAWTTGQINTAIDLDGNGDYLSVTGMMGNSANITLSGWLNLDNADTAGATLISLGDHVAIDIENDGATVHGFYYAGASTWPDTAYAITDLEGAGWHHFVYTYDDVANKQVLYVDGAPVTTTSHATSIDYAALGQNTRIGREGNDATTNDTDGRIDEVRVYNRALSADEVAQLYRLTTPTGVDTGLKGYWSFNGQDISGTTVFDRSGAGNTGTTSGSPVAGIGKVGQGLTFDGSDDFVGFGDMPALEGVSAVTYSLWFKPSALDEDSLFTKGPYLTDSGLWITDQAGSGFNRVLAVLRNGGDSYGYTAANKFVVGQWTHVVLVFDGSLSGNANRLKVYVNGTQETLTFSGTAIPATTASSTTDAVLGSTGAFDPTGVMDELRVYTRALSANEVAALYNQGR